MSTAYLLVLFFFVLVFVRNYHGIQRKVTARAFIFIFIFAFLLSALFPSLIGNLAGFFGFGRGTDFMFYNFVIFSIGIFGLLYKKIYLLERRLILLNRQVSIYQSKYIDEPR